MGRGGPSRRARLVVGAPAENSSTRERCSRVGLCGTRSVPTSARERMDYGGMLTISYVNTCRGLSLTVSGL